jgi:hypothetical protein
MRDFYPLVHRWLSKCASERKTRESAVLHVHLAYMYKNFEERELNHRAVTSILTAQMFLHNSYTFDMSEGKSKGSRVDHGRGSGLGFDQVEVFDLFQKHRNKCLAWLLSNQQACSEVMEEIERVLTMLDQSRAHASDDESNSPASMLPRQWISLSETGYVGRFQPDTEVRERAKRPSPDFDSYEDWLRYTTTQEVETEINVQMGTFTMKKQQMQVLPTEIASDPDFRHVFRNLATDLSVQCACVRKTTNRLWLRLLGRRHDVHWWAPDDRKPVSAHRRKYPSKLQPTEDWIRQKLQPVLAPYVHSMRVCVQLEDASHVQRGPVRLHQPLPDGVEPKHLLGGPHTHTHARPPARPPASHALSSAGQRTQCTHLPEWCVRTRLSLSPSLSFCVCVCARARASAAAGGGQLQLAVGTPSLASLASSARKCAPRANY